MAVRERSGGTERQARAMRRYRQLYRQTRLSRPSLLEGVASIFDFAGVFAPRSGAGTNPQSDAEAIASDWETVGDDLRAVIGVQEPDSQTADQA